MLPSWAADGKALVALQMLQIRQQLGVYLVVHALCLGTPRHL